MISNPKLYEINTRVFLRRYDFENKRAKLKDVPLSFWENIAERGFHYVWLMGIWETCSSTIEEHCFQEGLVQSYDRALKDWTRSDVIGSPYAINRYELNEDIATNDELKFFRKVLHSLGLKLILDFVPNHFSVDSVIQETHPDLFLSATEEQLQFDPHTFFRSKKEPVKILAHGRDPFFPAWTDTLQLNYYNPDTRQYMTDILVEIMDKCDGVRCDMSMLVMNNIFSNTWRGVIDSEKFPTPQNEFWLDAISRVKKLNQNFLLLAETYWDLEWDLQQLGFDFTYDKKLLDRLKDGSPQSIRDHLLAEMPYQKRSIRFIENHDEDRATHSLGSDRSLAAAVIISTIQGMQLFYDGQCQGSRVKLPVQLGREPKSQEVKSINKFYDKLFEITSHEIFQLGDWKLLEPTWAGDVNYTFDNFLAWSWSYKGHNRLIIVNYSDTVSQCRVKMTLEGYGENFKLIDLLNKNSYVRSTEEVIGVGLFVELHAYKCHIFSY